MSEALPLVSFVIPVLNDARRLANCLASVRKSDYPADRLEIIVADNGSTDGSDRVGREAGATVLSLPGRAVAQLRNDAVAAARGDIIAFVDADHEISPGWVRSAVETLSAPGTAAVGATYTTPPGGTWVQRQYDRLRRRDTRVRDTEWLGSGNLAIWRAMFEHLGGFDTSLETCEDVDLCQRLRAAGAKVKSDPRLESTHFGDPATLRELFFGELWRGRDNFRVSLRPPVTVRNLVGLGVTVAELLLLALAAAGLATIGLFGGPIAAVALIGIAALACLQSVRMLRSGAPIRFADVPQTFTVAGVYGVARALALVVRAPHRMRQQRSPQRG